MNRIDKGTTDSLPSLSTTTCLLQLLELLLQPTVLVMAIDQHTNKQADNSQCHQTDYRQLHTTHLCLFLLGLKQIDVVCHIHHLSLQGFTFTNKLKAVLQFGCLKGALPVAHFLIDINA